MSIRRRKGKRKHLDVSPDLLGRAVSCRAVGVVPAFTGKVVFVDHLCRFLHLEAADGSLWHRDGTDHLQLDGGARG